MGYLDEYKRLSESYRTDMGFFRFDDLGITIRNIPFHSSNTAFLPTSDESSDMTGFPSDREISENRDFSYPLIQKTADEDASRVIILLHGLNERSWDKYLPWAKTLCKNTGHPVILFPISFHMNRAPVQWSEPRTMSKLVKKRREIHPAIHHATFVNAAISSRLESCPQRFFLSGLETYFDLYDLIRQIQQGQHPVLPNDTGFHFFGYSIGAFLTEIMLMTNPENRLSDSKAFLFCGGTTFDKMNGLSKFILDSSAFEQLRHFFLESDFSVRLTEPVRNMVEKHKLFDTFRAMVDSLGYEEVRNKKLSQLFHRMQLCPLAKDAVIPVKAVEETFVRAVGKLRNIVRPLDFPYAYSHETPFPENVEKNLVNQAFETVFRRASSFLK